MRDEPMRDSDIDTLSADGAQEPYPVPIDPEPDEGGEADKS